MILKLSGGDNGLRLHMVRSVGEEPKYVDANIDAYGKRKELENPHLRGGFTLLNM